MSRQGPLTFPGRFSTEGHLREARPLGLQPEIFLLIPWRLFPEAHLKQIPLPKTHWRFAFSRETLHGD